MGKETLSQDATSGKLYRLTAAGPVTEVVVGTIASNRNGSVQGSAQETTTSTSYVAFASPDMTVTITTAGGPVFVFFSMVFQVSGGGANNAVVSVQLYLDSVAVSGAQMASQPGAASQQKVLNMTWLIPQPLSAASHTFQIQWKTTNATATAISNQRQLGLTELNVI